MFEKNWLLFPGNYKSKHPSLVKKPSSLLPLQCCWKKYEYLQLFDWKEFHLIYPITWFLIVQPKIQESVVKNQWVKKSLSRPEERINKWPQPVDKEGYRFPNVMRSVLWKRKPMQYLAQEYKTALAQHWKQQDHGTEDNYWNQGKRVYYHSWRDHIQPQGCHSQTSTSLLFALRHPFGRKRTLPPAWKAISARDTIRIHDLLRTT